MPPLAWGLLLEVLHLDNEALPRLEEVELKLQIRTYEMNNKFV